MSNSVDQLRPTATVPGVGELVWVGSREGSPLDGPNVNLQLHFPDDDTEPGYGCFMRCVNQYTRKEDDQKGYLMDERRPFPTWLTQFMTDVQEWTRAEKGIVNYDRGDYYKQGEIDLDTPTTAHITFVYPRVMETTPERFLGVPIENTSVFLGSAAMHLSQLYAEHTWAQGVLDSYERQLAAEIDQPVLEGELLHTPGGSCFDLLNELGVEIIPEVSGVVIRELESAG